MNIFSTCKNTEKILSNNDVKQNRLSLNQTAVNKIIGQ